MDQDDDHASFPSEWTLPDLPKGPGPPLLSTQFEDIFCGGDVGTVPLIGLADDEDINKTLVQEGDNGSADPGTTGTELISSIEETLEMTPPPGGFDSVQDDNNQVLVSDKADSNTVMKEDGESVTPLPAPDELVSTTSDRKEEEEGEGVSEEVTTFRRSKRLRSRTSEQNEVPLPAKKLKNTPSIPQDPSGTTDGLKVKEEQTDEQCESNNNTNEEDTPSDNNNDDDDDEGVGSSSSSSEDEEEDSDDPDKVWCICKQPHNDRFMICCDRCGEWYHGDCVGISVAEGKRMERNG